MQTETVAGIEYNKPTVVLLQDTGIGTSEMAARTCYDSFDSSENECIRDFNDIATLARPNEYIFNHTKNDMNGIQHSDLLDDLAWTYFHHSILEHANLTFLIKGTSRGVLQEHARHRIQAISVRSTRYTGSSILNAFVASQLSEEPRTCFADEILALDMFVTPEPAYARIEADGIYSKLLHQRNVLGAEEFNKLAVAKSSLPLLQDANSAEELYTALQAGKKKRNALDPFKNIVTDVWKVDMVVTFNLRSLKNYFTLRDSGAAYFGIRHLAQAMKDVTPSKYLDLILKAT